ncbi:hypothetical protein CKAN_00738300 [Cinnamomum micranthum f. kanehirae]|uniref:DUF2828 domain-containing protein n=1 Tax=Cinnamomum micranthum f. kanehirae TaxID=337451 RepID=A0A3S3M853_9MAGN|nr:hypothetical protein CKAN_00738300 [Cinnamomum micranthum f. kanehirae]
METDFGRERATQARVGDEGRGKYNSDSNYRFLYDKISDFLAESLKINIWFLDWGHIWKISERAAQWCPSLDSLLDYSTLLCESIAKRVFPRESDPLLCPDG